MSNSARTLPGWLEKAWGVSLMFCTEPAWSAGSNLTSDLSMAVGPLLAAPAWGLLAGFM